MASFFSKDNFKRLRLSLAFAILMAGIGAAIVYGSLRILHGEQQSIREAQAKNREVRDKLSRARDEEQEIKQKIARFNELQNAGIIGEEQRLDWIEHISQIKNARKLLGIQYELAPQQLMDSNQLAGNSGSFDFFASNMRLQMQLLHEEDLLNFLADLRATVPAFIRVRQCKVLRRSAQLHADCTIDWITLQERKGA